VTEFDTATRLAVDRTRLAYERTLMAWVRTSVSLISFGFSIYKFFQYLRYVEPGISHGRFSPREFAMLMIASGIATLGVAAADHRRNLRQLAAQFGPQPSSNAAILAILMCLVGVIGLVAVIMRL
jgi:putative membrane protein